MSQTSVYTRLRRFSAARGEASASGGPPFRVCAPQTSPRISWRKYFPALSFEERAKEDREAKMVGNPPHTSLNDHERLRFCGAKRRAASTVAARQSPRAASALACGRRSHDRSGRSVCVGFFFRHFHIAESCRPKACRENETAKTRVEFAFFAGRRPARSHCEKRGKSRRRRPILRCGADPCKRFPMYLR